MTSVVELGGRVMSQVKWAGATMSEVKSGGGSMTNVPQGVDATSGFTDPVTHSGPGNPPWSVKGTGSGLQAATLACPGNSVVPAASLWFETVSSAPAALPAYRGFPQDFIIVLVPKPHRVIY